MGDYVGETTSSLGGILSIKQTPPYRIRARTLLDLIRDDSSYGKESKKTWKMFRDKLRLKLYGSVSTTAVPVIAPHAHVSTDAQAHVSTPSPAHVSTPSPAHVSTEPHVHASNSPQAHVSVGHQAQVSTEGSAHVSAEDDGVVEMGRRGGAVRMSLMSLLEVEAAAYMNDDGEEEVVAEDGGGGGGGDGYNNCCVCMVRHKGAAFIPCGHTFCRLCSRELFVKRASCPLCNNLILEILDIF